MGITISSIDDIPVKTEEPKKLPPTNQVDKKQFSSFEVVNPKTSKVKVIHVNKSGNNNAQQQQQAGNSGQQPQRRKRTFTTEPLPFDIPPPSISSSSNQNTKPGGGTN